MRGFFQENRAKNQPPAHCKTSPLERAIPGSVSGRHGGRSSVKTQDCVPEEWTREIPFSIGCLPQQILKVSKADSALDERRGVLGSILGVNREALVAASKTGAQTQVHNRVARFPSLSGPKGSSFSNLSIVVGGAARGRCRHQPRPAPKTVLHLIREHVPSLHIHHAKEEIRRD